MASRSPARPSEETCWVCGRTPTVKNRRVLNSPVNKRILVGLKRLGASEEQLPSALVQRVYICKGCFSEVERYIKLQADVESVAASIRSKLRVQGLSIADSGPSIGGQVATEGRCVSSTKSCMILGSTNTHVYANKLYMSCMYIIYIYIYIYIYLHCIYIYTHDIRI